MPLVMPALRKPYTVEEVMKHNTPSSLWVIMNRKVYDVTAFHKKHPGGPGVLLQMGGKDATAAAAAAHKSILPANLMWEFCVGYIVRVKPQEEEKKVTKANSASSDPAPKAQVKKQKKAAAAEEQQADAADRVEALPGGCRLQNRCFSSPGRTQTGHKDANKFVRSQQI
ncbi:unnamed protein product [Effrenium voratum]|nr:unnamed protein product [Effrenium voratum]